MTVKFWPGLAFGVGLLLIAGCGGPTYRSDAPAPVIQRGEIPPQSRAEPPADGAGGYAGAPEIRAATPPPQGPIIGTVEPTEDRSADRPAPVESRDPAEVAIYAPAAGAAPTRSRPTRAVRALMSRAEQQSRAGDYTNAAANLERALRIDSSDARLWNRLAHVRQQQSRHRVAEELTAKSNALAHGADVELRRDNWLLIAKARSAVGNRSGADDARRQAERLRAP